MKTILETKLLKILIPSIILVLALSQTNILTRIRQSHSTAQAVGDLTIDWGVPSGQPIFVVENMMPGDTEPRTVKITNNASVNRPIGVRGIKTDETGDLGTALEITIKADGLDLYGGTSSTGIKTLTQFFSDSAGPEAIPLFNLNPAENKNVDFAVFFKSDSDNDFQAKKVVFDIKIGISFHIPEECQPIKFSGLPIFGTEKRDVINGTNGNDLIVAFEGNDVVNSSNGDDCIIGGPGNDILHGSNGNDVIFGNEGDDRIDGSNGDDKIFGGDGNDHIDADNGNDYVEAGSGDDIVSGSNGNDRIYGQAGNDRLDGGNGDDYIEGNDGDDRLEGGNGNDILIGGAGNDWANGGLGHDTCDTEVKVKCE